MVTAKDICVGSVVWTQLNLEHPLLVNRIVTHNDYTDHPEIDEIEVLYYDSSRVIRKLVISPGAVSVWSRYPGVQA